MNRRHFCFAFGALALTPSGPAHAAWPEIDAPNFVPIPVRDALVRAVLTALSWRPDARPASAWP